MRHGGQEHHDNSGLECRLHDRPLLNGSDGTTHRNQICSRQEVDCIKATVKAVPKGPRRLRRVRRARWLGSCAMVGNRSVKSWPLRLKMTTRGPTLVSLDAIAVNFDLVNALTEHNKSEPPPISCRRAAGGRRAIERKGPPSLVGGASTKPRRLVAYIRPRHHPRADRRSPRSTVSHTRASLA